MHGMIITNILKIRMFSMLYMGLILFMGGMCCYTLGRQNETWVSGYPSMVIGQNMNATGLTSGEHQWGKSNHGKTGRRVKDTKERTIPMARELKLY
jgi:hypothetical protein